MTLTTETPGDDSDLIESIPGVVFTASSIRLVMLASTISGLAPSNTVVTVRIGKSMVGNLSIPIF